MLYGGGILLADIGMIQGSVPHVGENAGLCGRGEWLLLGVLRKRKRLLESSVAGGLAVVPTVGSARVRDDYTACLGVGPTSCAGIWRGVCNGLRRSRCTSIGEEVLQGGGDSWCIRLSHRTGVGEMPLDSKGLQ